MRIVVVGRAGRTGTLTVAEAARRGHEVVATTLADLEETVASSAVLAGADAVVCTVDPRSGRRGTTVHSRGAERLCDAMWSAGVRRLVVASPAPAGPPAGRAERFRRGVRYALAGGTYRDLVRMEAVIADRCHLDATVVRVGRLGRAELAGHLVDEVERAGAVRPRHLTLAP